MVNRELRLRREADVRVARARGKAYADGPLVVRVMPHTSRAARDERRNRDRTSTGNRYAVVAGKRVGKAVERNRCKRLVREAIRRLHPQLRQGSDLVIIIRGGVDELTGLDVAEASLRRIAKRAGLLTEQSGTG